MPFRTAFTESFALQHPVALAPMGGAAGGALAAAVANAGGLGLIGGGRPDPGWLERELAIAAAGTDKAWGIGFQTWATDVATVERALSYRPSAVMLSFGDPRSLAAIVSAAGVPLIIQVTDVNETRQAVGAGADVIVAQGTEAGGHGGERGWSTLPFVPVVADLVAPVPVLAAGGIADGRGLAAALALGAAGALIGTRFLVALEALTTPSAAKAIIEAGGEDTDRSRVSDVARGSSWPARYPARTLRNAFFDQWRGRETDLAADAMARQAYRDAVARGEIPPDPVWASQAVDLVTGMAPAADILAALSSGAAQALDRIASGAG